ncbi:branched-chain amino acid transporter permease [Ihubacter sp. rT4E-8]|uniref:branched-chain amino acid transporter permease n=1 Tax=Ihubacter sp. rT4E-8 TaxID=3242369 RepID=UPI003CEAE0C8
MISAAHSLLLIGVMALGTMALRFLPFVLFSRGTPKIVLYLGEVLPYAVIAMLVVYCLKGTKVLSAPYGIPEAVSVLLVVLLHRWKHSTVLSILAGTICYMVLIRVM